MNRHCNPGLFKSAFVLVLLFLATFSPAANAAVLKAYVDKNIVQMGQFIQFSLSLSDKSASQDPDFSALEDNFEILSSMSRSSQTQIINGRMSSSTTWSITITPRKEGAIVIPPIELAGLQSEAITVVVGKSPEKQYSDAFFETKVSADEVYVQAQLLLELKLYVRMADISNSQLENLDIAGAKIIPVGEPSQSQVTKNGIRYYLIESSYFIFPEHSGELKIPSITYSAVVNEGSRYSRYGTRRRISAQSDAKTIRVKGIPSSYPKNAVWLPAQQVTLIETLNPQNSAGIGEPITRNISTKAIGQAASALPPASMAASAKLKVYPDKGDTHDKLTQGNLVGSRTDSFALIANQAGELQLPQYKIPWWDTQNDKLRYAQLDEKSITIHPGENQVATTGSDSNTLQDDSTFSGTGSGFTEINTTKPSELLSKQTFLLVIAALFVFWLITVIAFIVYIRKLKQNLHLENNPSSDAIRQGEAQKAAYKSFENTCKQNDIKMARSQLLEWANRYFSPRHVSGLTQLAQLLEDNALTEMLEQMDKQLYKQNDTSDKSEQLDLNALNQKLKEVIKQHKSESEKHSKGHQLESLYKH